jgi:hypothetical protein
MAAVTAPAATGAMPALGLPLPQDPGNPMGWLAGIAVNGIGDALITVLTAVWQAGLWLMQLAFRAIDAFTTPDLSADGPLRSVLPTTLWLGGVMAVIMMFVQLGLALVRRDGQSIGRVFLGIAQFGFVWVSFLAVGAGVVAAAAGLERAILSATLDVDTLAAWDVRSTFPREVTDVGAAFVLAITSLLVLIPAAFTDLLVSLVRDAALIVLVATAPISAAGLLSEMGRAWLWKTLRWFLAAAFIGPGSALVLGVGVQVSHSVVSGAGDDTTTAVGTAVVGAVLILVAGVAPLTLFRLLAFVEPSTVSGAAMRQAWADTGGPGGLFAGGGGTAGTGGAAAAGDGQGRSQGEATAASTTQSRVSGMLGLIGQGIQATTSIANRAVDLSTDVLGSAGVGHAGYSMTPADERALRAARASGGDGQQQTGPEPDPGQGPPTPPTPPAPPPPVPAGPPGGPGAGTGGGAGGSAGPGAAAGAGGAAGAVPVVP